MMSICRNARFLSVPIFALFCISGSKIHAQDITAKVAQEPAKASAPVGMVGKIEQIVIPGGELEAIPNDDPFAKMIVRVAESYRHGDSFRYDLEFTGFEPGRYDLAKYLQRKSREASSPKLPPIDVEILSVLEPGKIEPSRPEPPRIRSWWTYWTKLNIFVGLWIAGLAGLFHWSHRTRKIESAAPEKTPPPTVAQRLKPLVQAACDGTIEPRERAQLESLLIAYWTARSNAYSEISPGLILSKLKQDAEAGPLLIKLEQWLHMPPGQGRATDAEISELLKPYESVPDFEIHAHGVEPGAR